MKNFIDQQARRIAQITNEDGYAHIPAAYYYRDEHLAELLQLQQYYYALPPDTDPLVGRKFRSRASFTLQNGDMTLDKPTGYVQYENDNTEQMGKARYFEPTRKEILEMVLIRNLISSDLEIARETGKVDFSKDVEVGIHAIRYAPLSGTPSYSSPRWLHRDTEETVFVHLINLSGNAVGGENLISHNAKFSSAFTIIRLNDPLETLLVNRKYFHAVIPLTVGFGNVAYRDVLLVTFHNKKTSANAK